MREEEQADWRAFVSWKRRQLADGEVVEPSTLLMRRRSADGYEYRRPTAKEEAEFASIEAW